MLHGIWLTPDQFIIAGLVLVFIFANPFKFLKDWIPFMFLLLSFEYLRGLVPKLKGRVNIFPLIDADKFLFNGNIPTIQLQNILYTPGKIHLYDYFLSILYASHFVLPLAFAFYLWMHKKHKEFREYTTSLIVLAYAGFATYVLYPAMPPWMASNYGYIDKVHPIFTDAMSTFYDEAPSLPTIFNFFNPNPVAAMPSLHAAFPFLTYLFIAKIYGKKGQIFILYPLAVWFSVVYTGNHYVIDVIAGVIYAYAVFYGINYIWDKVHLRRIGGNRQEVVVD